MGKMSKLPIDKMNVDTEKALNYFKKNSYKFYSKKTCDSNEYEETPLSDGYNDILPLQPDCYLHFDYKKQILTDLDCKLMKLKQLIEQNATLFGQIEYLIRKVPVEDVLNYDIKLIIKYVLFNASAVYDRRSDFYFCYFTNQIVMENNTPLLFLGWVVETLMKYKTAYIFCDRTTAVVSYLFAELCEQAGLGSVIVIFLENLTEVCKQVMFVHAITIRQLIISGCVGVVTENADVDSAVDVLLEATDKYPWKLKHLLVQESVYDVFKKALQWKTRDSTNESSKEKLCAQVFNYKNKSLLLDYVRPECEQEIPVEAYRTTKELLSMLSKSDYEYMSLWTSSLSEANEISRHPAASDLVWINGYGTFDGPAASSQVVYTNLNYKYFLHKYSKYHHDNLYSENNKKWLKLPFSERFDKIFSILCEHDSNATLKGVKEALKRRKSTDSVSVSDGTVCEYSFRPCNNIKHSISADSDNLWVLLNGLILGAYIEILEKYINADMSSVISALSEAGAPVAIVPTYSKNGDYIANEYDFAYKMKVIYSNYGSIFAN